MGYLYIALAALAVVAIFFGGVFAMSLVASGFAGVLSIPLAVLIAKLMNRGAETKLGLFEAAGELVRERRGFMLLSVVPPLGLWLGGLLPGWLGWLSAALTWVMLGASGVIAVVLLYEGVQVGRAHRAYSGTTAAQRRSLNAALGDIAGLTPQQVELGVLAFHREGDTFVITGPPAAVRAAASAGERVQQHLPGYTSELRGAVCVVRPMTPEEETCATSGGLVVGYTADGTLRLADSVRDSAAQAVDAWVRQVFGATLTEWDTVNHTARFEQLDATTLDARNRIAARLGCWPHELEVRVAHDDQGIESVEVLRAPAAKAQDGETRLGLWKRVLLASVPGAHDDWEVRVNPITDEVTMWRRARRVLQKRVSLEEVLPDRLDPTDWAHIPLGKGPGGDIVSFNLDLGPHVGVQGVSGSGKSILLLTHLAGALARGHSICVIDPMKACLDFESLRPFARGWAETIEEAATLEQRIYAEGQRRKALLKEYRVVNALALPAEVRERENITPMTVIIDEFIAAVAAT